MRLCTEAPRDNDGRCGPYSRSCAVFAGAALQCEAKLQEVESDYGLSTASGLHPFKTAVCCELLGATHTHTHAHKPRRQPTHPQSFETV